MALKSIEEEWQNWASKVFKDVNVTDAQVRCMKQAFFGGSFVTLLQVKEIGEPHISERDGILHLENTMDELVDFHKDQIKVGVVRN